MVRARRSCRRTDARRHPDPEVLAGGRRALHHLSRWSSRRIRRPGRGTSAPTACRCSTAAAPGCTGSVTRAARSITVSPSGWEADAGRSGARARIPRWPTPRPRRCPRGLDELMLAGFLRGARRARQVRDRRSRGPANAQIVLEGYVEPGERRARAVRRSHRRLLAPGRLPGLPPDLHHAPQAAGLSHDRRRIPPMEDYYLGKASERIFLP
jgi:hypothetical protein